MTFFSFPWGWSCGSWAKSGNKGSTEAPFLSMWRMQKSSYHGCRTDTPSLLGIVGNLPKQIWLFNHTPGLAFHSDCTAFPPAFSHHCHIPSYRNAEWAVCISALWFHLLLAWGVSCCLVIGLKLNVDLKKLYDTHLSACSFLVPFLVISIFMLEALKKISV